MSGARDVHEFCPGKFADEFCGALGGEKTALLPAKQKNSRADLAKLRRGAGGHGEPARVELEPPTAVRFEPDRVFGDVAKQLRFDALGGGDHAVSIDGLFPGRIGAAQREGETRHPARASTGAPGKIEQGDLLGFRMTRCMVEGHLGTHGVTDKAEARRPEVIAQGFQVAVEAAHLELLGIVGVAVTAKIEGDDVKMTAEPARQVVPPMDVCAAAVE